MSFAKTLSRRALLAGVAMLVAIPRVRAGDTGNFKPTEPPVPVPELGFSDASGQPVDLKAYLGRPVLLNVWATWCGPCVAEMPALARLQAAMPDLVVLPVSTDRDGPARVQEFFRDHGIVNLPVLLERDLTVRRLLRPRGLPLTLLINARGQEVGRAVGEVSWDDPTMVTRIRQLVML